MYLIGGGCRGLLWLSSSSHMPGWLWSVATGRLRLDRELYRLC